jgi:hypothetical protein
MAMSGQSAVERDTTGVRSSRNPAQVPFERQTGDDNLASTLGRDLSTRYSSQLRLTLGNTTGVHR